MQRLNSSINDQFDFTKIILQAVSKIVLLSDKAFFVFITLYSDVV